MADCSFSREIMRKTPHQVTQFPAVNSHSQVCLITDPHVLDAIPYSDVHASTNSFNTQHAKQAHEEEGSKKTCQYRRHCGTHILIQNYKTRRTHTHTQASKHAHTHKYTCTAAQRSHLLAVVEKFLSTKCCAVMTQVCEFSSLVCVPDYCIMASA